MSDHAFSIDADHPCLDGHFPGAPIVPGVMLLDRVIEAAGLDCAACVVAISRCKFRAGLYPGEVCTIALKPMTASRLRFDCTGPGGTLAEGVLELTCDADG